MMAKVERLGHKPGESMRRDPKRGRNRLVRRPEVQTNRPLRIRNTWEGLTSPVGASIEFESLWADNMTK